MSELDIPGLLKAVSQLDPSARALQIEQRWYSWQELTDGADALQRALAAEGLSGEGLPVGVVMHSTASTVSTILSLLVHRQTMLTLNHMQSSQRLAASIGDLEAAAVVGIPEDWTDETLLAVRETGRAAVSVASDNPADVEILCHHTLPDETVDALRRPNVAVAMLTSGTTGPPKRIPVSYAKWAQGLAGGLQFTSARDVQPKLRTGITLLATPLTHLGGVWRIVFSFASGRAIAMLPRFDVDAWVALVKEHTPPLATVPPPVLQMILDQGVAKGDLASLKALMVGTAPLAADLAERFEDAYGIFVLANYGATEFAGAVASWTLADRQQHRIDKRGSVGRAHPGVSLRVVDTETGAQMPTGEVGLLEIKAPQLTTAGPDGWLRTNDLAAIDADGFLFIRGRIDDAIIRGGFKVSAGEVADVLRTHPDVRDAAVVGMPDERLGAVPVAAVTVRDGASADGEAIRNWSRERLLAYQVPARLVVFNELPRGATFKVDASALRDLLTGP